MSLIKKMDNDARNLNFNLRISYNFNERLSQAALDCEMKKTTLAELFEYMGYLLYEDMKKRFKQGGNLTFGEILTKHLNDMDLGPYTWDWSLNKFLLPALNDYNLHQLLLKGIKHNNNKNKGISKDGKKE